MCIELTTIDIITDEDDDVKISLDYNVLVSIDIAVSPNYSKYNYEAYIYNMDGSGDYVPMEVYFNELPTEQEIKEEYGNFIEEVKEFYYENNRY